MPESEIFKIILQLGSFGLLAIAVVWMLFYGAPMLRDMHQGAILRFKEELAAERSQCMVNHREIMARQDKVAEDNRELHECNQERNDKLHQETRHAVKNLQMSLKIRGVIDPASGD